MGSYGSYRIKSAPMSEMTYSCGHTAMKSTWPEELAHKLKCAIEIPCTACDLTGKKAACVEILARIDALELPALVKPEDMDEQTFSKAEYGRRKAIDAVRTMCADPANFFFPPGAAEAFEKMLTGGGTDARRWLRLLQSSRELEGHRCLSWWRSSAPNPLG